MKLTIAGMIATLVAAGGGAGAAADSPDSVSPGPAGDGIVRSPQVRPSIIELWEDGKAVFGVFVPNERPRSGRGMGRGQPPLYTSAGAARLARNPLYDFVFLNLELGYDAGSVAAVAEGLRSGAASAPPALLVRIPPVERDGAEAARGRVAEILAAGADGVVFPHVRSPDEAALAVSFMTGAGAEIWSPTNRDGTKISMIMIEDPESLARVAETAAVPGISILACGIGSLRGALGGDRDAAEAGNQEVLARATRAGVVDMITAGVEDVGQRIEQGFLALLMQGPGADEAIRMGRAAAGRQENRE